MTCVIGLLDKENDCVYMGGDSCASTSYLEQTLFQRKVFKSIDTSNAIMGFSGSVRDLNLLTYAENLIDKRDEPNIDHKYLVTKFIPNITQLFSNGHTNILDKGVNEIESYFMFAYKNKLYLIESNYAVLSVDLDYQAIGCGVSVALGSLFSTEGTVLAPVERIHKALQSSSKFNRGVSPPFYIINTKDDNVITFKE